MKEGICVSAKQKQPLSHIEDKRQVSGWEWHPQPLTGKCTTQENGDGEVACLG